MRGKSINQVEIDRIINLRETGHSLPEICKLLERGGSTVFKYAKDVAVLPEYVEILRQKQGGSKFRSINKWNNASNRADKFLKKIEKRDKLLILTALYWGEGTKSGFDMINSDPSMVRVFIDCLMEVGVNRNDLRISIRIYDDVHSLAAKRYWAEICGVDVKRILSVNILRGKKIGKLPYGMCRIRVTKGSEYFKLIMSMITFIKLQLIPASIVQRIEQGTPKP